MSIELNLKIHIKEYSLPPGTMVPGTGHIVKSGYLCVIACEANGMQKLEAFENGIDGMDYAVRILNEWTNTAIQIREDTKKAKKAAEKLEKTLMNSGSNDNASST